MAEALEELPVIRCAYQLLIWTTRHLGKFPRLHRHTIGARLESYLYGVLEQLLRCRFDRNRLPILRQVNMDLEILRYQFRLARDLRCLPMESYGFAAENVNEIGRMVGGWLKQSGREV